MAKQKIDQLLSVQKTMNECHFLRRTSANSDKIKKDMNAISYYYKRSCN